MLGRRRYERVAFFCPLQLTELRNGTTVPASSFDIGIGGVGLTTEIALERGQPVRVRFCLRHESNGETDEDVLGQVAYCRADEDGNRIGIEFLEVVRESTQPALVRRLNSL